jgi:ABC-type dipeptide/oligopeptide/nickel transport system permease component
LYKAYTAYDPDRANQLLDEIGLTKRDSEGFRTFKDGTRMSYFLFFTPEVGEDWGQFIVDDWARVGIRLVQREQGLKFYTVQSWAREHDFAVWDSNSEIAPLARPTYFVPLDNSSTYAAAYGRWYKRGGLYGNPMAARRYGCIEPPENHPLRRAMEVYEEAIAESDPIRQRDIFREVLQIAAENTWCISISSPPPVLAIVKNGFRNVPPKAIWCEGGNKVFNSPGNLGVETFFFDKPYDSPGAVAMIKKSIVEPTLPPDLAAIEGHETTPGKRVGAILRYSFVAIFLLIVVLVSVRHPYIGRRLLIMIPTLFIISIIVFVVIQLPPGDYVTIKIIQLREAGDVGHLEHVKLLKEIFHLEKPIVVQYIKWMGFEWFGTFDKEHTGLLQGNMGRSMETCRYVHDIVGDRILLTFLISLGTILFTWILAIPIGIYSAIKQYSIMDYILTFFGFIGMCIPGFLFALLLVYVSAEWLGFPVSGLFSAQYGAQPEWDWPKFLDLLKHIWLPIAVLGIGGTAAMIRVMRSNLLDELRKPYVVTAQAKGVRPIKLLLKYPVRMALNPFISSIGQLFPQLVSGGAIVGMVLSLPTVGPLLLSALMAEDMYLAGSMLMLLSVLSVLGTLISDLLLLKIDPRIRFQKGGR